MGRGEMMKSMVVVVIMVMLIKGTAAKTLTVGDETGWKVPPSLDFYSSWAAKQTFAVGDTLEFKYTGTHTVAKVTSKEAYDNCNLTAVEKGNLYTTGPTEIPLSEGEVFFFCTSGTHCVQGQKFAVSVTATGSGSTPVPVPDQGSTGSQVPPEDQPPPESPPTPPANDSAPKPMTLTWATLSLFVGALVLAFGYF